MDKLKACPHCGETEGVTLSETNTGFVLVHWWQVECHGCCASIVQNTEAEAIAAWNTRVDDSETRSDDHQTGLPSAGDTQAPSREQQLEQALKVAREALAAVKQHDDSAFLGPDREKNARASWRGVRRKAGTALAKIDDIGGVG